MGSRFELPDKCKFGRVGINLGPVELIVPIVESQLRGLLVVSGWVDGGDCERLREIAKNW